MKITVKADDFYQEVTLSKQQGEKLTRDVWAKVRSVALDTERAVKRVMPVDTGRARASWGNWTPGDLVKENQDASDLDHVWEEKARELTVEQGSNVEYIEELNAGRNKKRISGFIDAAERNAHRELDADIDRLLSRYF